VLAVYKADKGLIEMIRSSAVNQAVLKDLYAY